MKTKLQHSQKQTEQFSKAILKAIYGLGSIPNRKQKVHK